MRKGLPGFNRCANDRLLPSFFTANTDTVLPNLDNQSFVLTAEIERVFQLRFVAFYSRRKTLVLIESRLQKSMSY